MKNPDSRQLLFSLKRGRLLDGKVIMLFSLLPFMTEEIAHWFPPVRDIFGRLPSSAAHSMHRAKITYTQGARSGGASGEALPDATATIWLIDHPRLIAVGDTFKLPCGAMTKAARVERRTLDGAEVSKVYLT